MDMEEFKAHLDKTIEQSSKVPYSKNPLKDVDDNEYDEEDDIE